jgi:hypothetical protein
MSSHRESFDTINITRGWKELKKISTNYCGLDDFMKIKKIEKLQIKESSLRCSTVFLKRCYKNDLIPKGLKIKNTISHTKRIDNLFKTFNLRLLKELIHLNYEKAERIAAETKNIKDSLESDNPEFLELSPTTD